MAKFTDNRSSCTVSSSLGAYTIAYAHVVSINHNNEQTEIRFSNNHREVFDHKPLSGSYELLTEFVKAYENWSNKGGQL